MDVERPALPAAGDAEGSLERAVERWHRAVEQCKQNGARGGHQTRYNYQPIAFRKHGVDGPWRYAETLRLASSLTLCHNTRIKEHLRGLVGELSEIDHGFEFRCALDAFNCERARQLAPPDALARVGVVFRDEGVRWKITKVVLHVDDADTPTRTHDRRYVEVLYYHYYDFDANGHCPPRRDEYYERTPVDELLAYDGITWLTRAAPLQGGARTAALEAEAARNGSPQALRWHPDDASAMLEAMDALDALNKAAVQSGAVKRAAAKRAEITAKQQLQADWEAGAFENQARRLLGGVAGDDERLDEWVVRVSVARRSGGASAPRYDVMTPAWRSGLAGQTFCNLSLDSVRGEESVYSVYRAYRPPKPAIHLNSSTDLKAGGPEVVEQHLARIRANVLRDPAAVMRRLTNKLEAMRGIMGVYWLYVELVLARLVLVTQPGVNFQVVDPDLKWRLPAFLRHSKGTVAAGNARPTARKVESKARSNWRWLARARALAGVGDLMAFLGLG